MKASAHLHWLTRWWFVWPLFCVTLVPLAVGMVAAYLFLQPSYEVSIFFILTAGLLVPMAAIFDPEAFTRQLITKCQGVWLKLSSVAYIIGAIIGAVWNLQGPSWSIPNELLMVLCIAVWLFSGICYIVGDALMRGRSGYDMP